MGNRENDMKRLLPRRKSDAHKGECGRIFILGGSEGMTGAVCLAAMGAMRTGAGLVTVGTADCDRGIVATKLTEAMTIGFSSVNGCIGYTDREKIKAIADKSGVLVLGPGIGRERETKELVLWLVKNTETKIVLDADGLNAVSSNIDILKGRKGEIILTPHEGEMSLLCGKTIEEIKENREKTAVDFAKKYGITLVLKGKNTVVTNGEEVFVNPSGNPGMATGGSGDVLAGVVGSLLGQGLTAYDGAVLGAYIHGRAGDLAKADKGEMGLIASDIVDNLPYAIKELSGE
ncbi:MAG: NAD(P)H-hydrate dehydratase [Ruminococcaceae bacterium]|nr:NAD(P)H-hydrate dehydratase [Oscillospiraceae bacterium]